MAGHDWTWFKNTFRTKYGTQWSDAFIGVAWDLYQTGDYDDTLDWVFKMMIAD